MRQPRSPPSAGAATAGRALAPVFGTIERYRLMEWLNFIATEIHKGLGPLWKPATPDAYKASVLAAVGARFDHVAKALGTKPYLTGDAFTIADAYLFTIVNWHRSSRSTSTAGPRLRNSRRASPRGRPCTRRSPTSIC
ncbi:MAG TPA: glutathione binding-like protein [Casimicrobiaceae bacterium]|nr:glutathione binding-like protein [Casimicrobiaceae bacterium]